MVQQLNIKEINGMNKPKFMMTFGNVVEKCPQAALHLLTRRPYMNTYEVLSSLEEFFDALTIEDKMKILHQHPELASLNKHVTEDSVNEQTKSGLTTLPEHTQSSFTELNSLYRKKFGFPFIMCVAGSDPHKILSSMQERLDSDVESEINAGIREVKKISKHRLSNLIVD
nr:PREDICTED: 2-oxo-4-hydroxy-4-carboxy-5-ureidoimidazoline decarboxylase-like [Bemisia tabaci]